MAALTFFLAKKFRINAYADGNNGSSRSFPVQLINTEKKMKKVIIEMAKRLQ